MAKSVEELAFLFCEPTRALTKGMTIDKVSKLMGHANIKETEIYAKIIGKILDKAMELFE